MTYYRVAKLKIRRVFAAASWLLALFCSSWICHGCYYVTEFIAPGPSTRVIMPADYEGPLLIIWSVHGGQRAELRDGGRLHYFRMTDDGAMLIADDPPGPHPFGLPFFGLRGTLTFWRDLPGPYMQHVPNECPDDHLDQWVGLCDKGIGGFTITSNGVVVRRGRPYQSYIVATYKNKKTASVALEALLSTYRHETFFPPEGRSP